MGYANDAKSVSVRSLKRGDDPHAAANLGQSKRRVRCALRCLPDKASIGHLFIRFLSRPNEERSFSPFIFEIEFIFIETPFTAFVDHGVSMLLFTGGIVWMSP